MSDINEKSGFAFTFQPVTKLFEEQVRLHPEKCAVASGKESPFSHRKGCRSGDYRGCCTGTLL